MRRSPTPLGARRDYVLLRQLVGKRAAQYADDGRGAGGADHDQRHRHVLEQVDHAPQAPRRRQVTPAENSPPGAPSQDALKQEHQDQRQKKIGRCQADEAEDRERVVAHGTRMGGRVDADRYCQQVGDQQRGEGGAPPTIRSAPGSGWTRCRCRSSTRRNRRAE